MFETESASKEVKFALLEGQLLSRELDRTSFVQRASQLGLPAAAVSEAADKYLAIAANQTAVPVGNLIRLVREVESRNASAS